MVTPPDRASRPKVVHDLQFGKGLFSVHGCSWRL